jgi:Flp pilus assembly protein TadD
VDAPLRRRFDEARDLLRRGEHDRAIVPLQEVVAAHPDSADARTALAMACYGAGQLGAAVDEFRELHRRCPQDVKAASNLAAILSEVGQQEEALERVGAALRLDPANVGALSNLGEILRRLGNWEGARDVYATALTMAPEDPTLHLQHGLALLGLGNWGAGWPEYEYRFRSTTNPISMEPVSSPRLQPGESPRGRRVLIVHEQGLGDSVMFSRLAAALAARGATVHLRAPAALVPLLGQLAGVASCTAIGTPMPAHDVHVPLLSLPHALRLRAAMVSGTPYLHAPGPCPPHVAAALPPDDRLTVALCWSGNPRHVDNRRRSIRTELLEPLRGLPGVRMATLQKSPGAEELLPAAWRADWVDAGAACHDFADSAHALERVDLVVTVDSAVAHLAGALGRPTRLLLPVAPDFRWELGTDRSRWYDTLRLVRQEREFDWPGVIVRVREEILRLAAERRGGGAIGS